MDLHEIKAAVEAGLTVYWKTLGYRVIKDSLGQWLIAYGEGTRQANYIGLTWRDGTTMNGDAQDFYAVHPERDTWYCENCWGFDVRHDATVKWDGATQSWSVVGVLDDAKCECCGDSGRPRFGRPGESDETEIFPPEDAAA